MMSHVNHVNQRIRERYPFHVEVTRRQAINAGVRPDTYRTATGGHFGRASSPFSDIHTWCFAAQVDADAFERLLAVQAPSGEQSKN